MADTQQRAISGIHLWALLIAWALVLTPLLAAAGWVAYQRYLAPAAPLTSTDLPAEETVDATPMPASEEVRPKLAPRLAWQGEMGGSMEEAPAEDESLAEQSVEQVTDEEPTSEQQAALDAETSEESAAAQDTTVSGEPNSVEASDEQPEDEPAREAAAQQTGDEMTSAEATGDVAQSVVDQSDGPSSAEMQSAAVGAEAEEPIGAGGQTEPEAAQPDAPHASVDGIGLGVDDGSLVDDLPLGRDGSTRGDDVSVGLEAAAREAARLAASSDEEHVAITMVDDETDTDAIGGGGPVADGASPAALPLTRQPGVAEVTDETERPAWLQHGEQSLVSDEAPRIAVVMTSLGLSAASTEAAIRQLPSAVTLSFTPYSRRLNDWIALARANDHEVMIDLPMEPATFPEDDPGPHALLTVLNQSENEKRLDWLLGRGKAFVGVAAVMGSRFIASELHMLPVLETLQERGLLYLDNRSSRDSTAGYLAGELGTPYVAVDRALDSDQASRIAINGRLTELERLSIENGFAVGVGQPYPVTIERLRDWSETLAQRGYALVPITSLAGAERRQQLSAGQ